MKRREHFLVIAQITDLHLRVDGTLFNGNRDTEAELATCVDHLNQMQPRPDVVLATGDLADVGTPDVYRKMRRMLDRIELPVYVIPGNHDDRDMLRAVFVDLTYSWFRRGWGDRWGKDPLAFIPTVDAGADPVPWFAAEWAEEYLALRPADRVIRSILALLSLFEQTYRGLTPERQRRVHFLAYERLLSEPEREVGGLAKFLGTEPLDGIATVFEREGLPAAGTGAPGDKLKKIEGLAAPENVARLVEAGRRHEKAWGLAPMVA